MPAAFSQSPVPKENDPHIPVEKKKGEEEENAEGNTSENNKTDRDNEDTDEKAVAVPGNEDSMTAPIGENTWYERPSAKQRFLNYTNKVAGPVAVVRYATVAGVLTGRNAPREWGGKTDGFGKRFASNFGKSVIKNSINYGLDEALKLDSRYYLSRKRRPAARARNAVFSTVTSRNRYGNRVIGVPKIAGHLTANVAAAELWYPKRYTYRHGLKGAAISLAIDASVNLFREFVWKK